jgi:hypothetical protein
MMSELDAAIERDNLWKVLFLNGVDSKEFGSIGYITDLFRVFNEVVNFRLKYSEERNCSKCSHSEYIDTISKGPLIYIPQQRRKSSFQESYLSMINTDDHYNCAICNEASYTIKKTNVSEPCYLALLDDTCNPRNNQRIKPLSFATSFTNPRTKKQYELISTINLPYANHYNCLLKDPYFEYQKQSKGFFLHDGLLNDGKIVSILSDEIKSVAAYIAIYKLKE